MAIIIPSSKTYNRQNPKIRDNIIERIEISAVKAESEKNYNQRVYGEETQTENLWERGSAVQDNILSFYTQGFTSYINNVAQGTWVAGVGGGAYPLYKTITFNLSKTQSNQTIEKIFFGQTDGKNEIKSTITYDYGYYDAFAKINYDSSKGEYYLSYLNGYIPQKGAERKSSSVLKLPTTFSSSIDMGIDGTMLLNVVTSLVDNTNIATAKVVYNEEDDTYNLSLTVLCGFSEFKVVFGEEGSFESLGDSDKPSVDLFRPKLFSSSTPPTELSNTSGYGQISKGYIIDYKPLKIEISLYGDTISLNIKDEILYINGETAKKVYSVDGNELMQTGNYKTEEKTLVENTDYWVGTSSNVAQTYFYTSVHLYSKYPIETYVDYTLPNGETGTVIIKAFATTHSPAIASTGGYVTVNKVYRKSISTTLEYFKKTQENYANGKETSTIRCSIGDYFDENGEKKIAIDNSTQKMSFREYDEVTPMVYGADGKDYPMSYVGDKAKVFQVLGVKPYYDGAVWQELYLQECGLLEIKEEEPDIPTPEQLTAPTISLDGDILTMTATDDRTQEFVIFVDGVEKATVANGTDENYTVSGTWLFNETINPPAERIIQEVNCIVDTSNNGSAYSGNVTEIDIKTTGDILYRRYNNGSIVWQLVPYTEGAWKYEVERTITFDGVQTVSKEFYDWLVANAKRPISGTWKLNAEIPNIAYNGFLAEVNFKCNGVQMYAIITYDSADGTVVYDDGASGSWLRVYDNDKWLNENYRLITFDGTQYMTNEDYELFILDAVFAFTIDGTTCYAKEGMTWGEWVESEYNTGGFVIDSDRYIRYGTQYYIHKNSTIVTVTETIESTAYTLETAIIPT